MIILGVVLVIRAVGREERLKRAQYLAPPEAHELLRQASILFADLGPGRDIENSDVLTVEHRNQIEAWMRWYGRASDAKRKKVK